MHCVALKRALLVLVPLTGLVACRDFTQPEVLPSRAPTVLTQLPRALTSAETTVRDASNAFSFALWSELNEAQPDTNVFVSPLSASFALGMAMNGAAGVTYDQMQNALQFSGAPLAGINAGYQSLIGLLESLDPGVRMQVANSIWYRNGFPVLPAFLDTTQKYFDATVKGLNFSDAVSSLAAINGWVSDATNGKISNVLSEIDPSQMMFLVNAIYFKGSWRTQFDPGETTAATFTSGANAPQPMQLMHLVSREAYAETPTYQAVDLPYGDSAFTMTVLLPTAGTGIEALAASLTPAAWQSLVGSLSGSTQVDLSLPKITLTYARTLNPDLKALGMVEPFSQTGANFTHMAPAPTGNQLYVGFVQQNSYLDIDEEGTEAAAVTTVGITATAVPLPPVVMRVDHPYIVVIRERLTGTVLFMGKVVSMP